MNLPLNIDWQQILLHLLNFCILAFGLYMLLYKPVKAFMDKRSKYYADIDKEANDKQEKISSLEADYNAKIANLEQDIRDKKLVAEKSIEEQSQKELKAAQAEANRIISEAKEEGEVEKQRIIASSKREIADLAVQAVDKLLKERGDKNE